MTAKCTVQLIIYSQFGSHTLRKVLVVLETGISKSTFIIIMLVHVCTHEYHAGRRMNYCPQ